MDNKNNQSFADLWPSTYFLRAATAIPAKVDLFTFGSVSVVVS